MFNMNGITAVLALVSAASFATANVETKAAAQKAPAQVSAQQTNKSPASIAVAKEVQSKRKGHKKLGF